MHPLLKRVWTVGGGGTVQPEGSTGGLESIALWDLAQTTGINLMGVAGPLEQFPLQGSPPNHDSKWRLRGCGACHTRGTLV